MPEQSPPLRFDEDGLIPAVVVSASDGDVLMVGFMNEDALARTRESGLVHFWSRSRRSLWKKGGTSGHVQRVREIRVNCDLNSLLIEADQEGAVCHDGYRTCYYRRLDSDGRLHIVRDRAFDPLDVYPESGHPHGLATQTRKWWAAYEWLRDHDLRDESGTSRRLHADSDESTPRVGDELRELAGVLDGTHRHGSMDEDLRLEAGQVLYWIACAGVWHGYRWEQIRPDRALDVQSGSFLSPGTMVRLLRARADEIDDALTWPNTAMLHDTIALVGTVLRANGIDPLDIVNTDLADLNAKPYLPDLTALDS
jgi:phosphoribosyl-AMP cyclohydrolase